MDCIGQLSECLVWLCQRQAGRIVERCFAREVPVDAAMAHTKGTGNIDHGRFGRPEAAEDLLRCFENTFGSECFLGPRFCSRPRSLSS
jgi:hypothetical protein